MQYVLSVGGALLLASTVRFITGNMAGLCTFVAVLACSIVMDRRPAIFFLLSLAIAIAARALSRYVLGVMLAVPLIAVLVLLATHSSLIPMLGPFLADAILLISLAYRGWANKRLVD